jgi:hypothetical protein
LVDGERRLISGGYASTLRRQSGNSAVWTTAELECFDRRDAVVCQQSHDECAERQGRCVVSPLGDGGPGMADGRVSIFLLKAGPLQPSNQALEIRLIGRKLSSIGTEQFRHELSCIELKGELR